MGAEFSGSVWFCKIYGGFGVGSKDRLCVLETKAVNVLALFNVSVRKEWVRAFSFYVGVHSEWDTYALGHGKMSYELLCSRLDGGLAQSMGTTWIIMRVVV